MSERPPLDPVREAYRPRDDADLIALVRANPFAWVVSEAGGFSATPLPIRPRLDDDGRLIGLKGHFGRNNPQVERLRAVPRARFLFMGPHGYVSPSWMADRSQAPTWNYACAVIDCDLTLVEDAAGIEALLRDLIEARETGRPDAWSPDEMGERFARLARGVVGFTAEIRDVRAVFKMGQDERNDVFADILAGLDREPGGEALTAMMRDFGSGRA